MSLLLVPCGVRAEEEAPTATLHVFGPEGTATERRALAVLEREGGCASWEGATLAAEEEGVSVTLEDMAGPCARWIHIAADSPQQVVTVRAAAEGLSAATAVGMGGERGLEVEATRAGARITVRVTKAPPDEPVGVMAYWAGGSAVLDRVKTGTYRGEVPADRLVGVVARSGTLTGAAVAAAAGEGRPAGPTAVLMPSNLAIPAGGAPRTAAFMAVADARGRLSRTVPLRVTSERGTLRRLRWIKAGLAAIELSAAAGVESVDLVVRGADETLASAELAVAAGWPVSGRIEAPAGVEVGGEVEVVASAVAAGGEAVDLARVAVRCGGAVVDPSPEGVASCAAAAEGPLAIVLVAIIDGRPVPLASTTVEVTASRPPQPGPEPQPQPQPPPQPQPQPQPLWLGATLGGGVDLWVRGGVVVGADLELRLWRWLRLAARLDYTATILDVPATPDDPVLEAERVEGAQHAISLFAGLGGVFPVGPVSLVARAGLGGAYAYTAATTSWREGAGQDQDTTAGSGSDARFLWMAWLGVRVPLGPVDLCVGASPRGTIVETGSSWGSAPFGVLLEVGVGGGLGGDA